MRRLLCFFGWHARKGWWTDYSLPYSSVVGVFAHPGSRAAQMRKYREFNRCRCCGDVKVRFTNG